MSSGTLFVRFPDGEVRYGIYHGTCNLAQPPLFDTIDAAWEHRRSKCDHPQIKRISNSGFEYSLPSCAVYDEGEGDPVDVYTNYGGDWFWCATATRTHLTSGHDGAEVDQREGTPPWVKEALDAASTS